MSSLVENAIPESQIRLPKNSYRLRCIECKPGTTKKTSEPMLIQTWEIFSAAPITQDGNTIQLDGVKILHWSVLSEKSLVFANQQRESLGMPKIKIEDVRNVSADSYLGQEGCAVAVSEIEEEKNDVTGEAIINPNTGKPVVSYRKTIKQWLPRS